MTPELEALALLNSMFESYDGRPVDNAVITRKDYAFLAQVLTRRQTFSAHVVPEEKATVAVTLTTHAALDLLAEAFKENNYPGHAAQLLDRKGFIQDKPLVKVIGEENPNMAAIREAVSLLAATIAGTNPPGAAWASVRNRMDELTALLSPLAPQFKEKP